MFLSKKNIDDVISSIANSDDPISKELFQQYAQSLRRGVGSVFADGSFHDLHAQLDANVARFAAYKAFIATQRIRQAVASDGDIDQGRYEVNKFNRWLAAEYNTTVSRSRTAKQWSEWDSDEERQLFPNIMWLPSRSVNQREQHILFYNRVWAKNDPFWDHNQPGTLWNCKCDWQQTDDPVTDNNPKKNITNQGLEGNPAKTGEIFSDKASYFVKSPKDIEHTCNKIVFKDQLAFAKANFQNKFYTNQTSSLDIKVTGGGIKEFLNQNCDEYYTKNALAYNLDKVLMYSKHIKQTMSEGRKSEIFGLTIGWKNYFLICNWNNDGILQLHSISESPKLLK